MNPLNYDEVNNIPMFIQVLENVANYGENSIYGKSYENLADAINPQVPSMKVRAVQSALFIV